MRSTRGTPKASVLPEPVGDLTSTSCPASTSGTTSRCTGNGVAMPRADSAPATAWEAPRSVKDGDAMETPCCGDWSAATIPGDSTDPDRWSARDKNLAGDLGVARSGTLAPGEHKPCYSSAVRVSGWRLLHFSRGSRRPPTSSLARAAGRPSSCATWRPRRSTSAYGSWYLTYLLRRYRDDEALAVAAYNAGGRHVDAWVLRAGGREQFDLDHPPVRARGARAPRRLPRALRGRARALARRGPPARGTGRS